MNDIPLDLYDKLFDYYMYKLRTKYPTLNPISLEAKANKLTREELGAYNENDDARRLLDAI